MSLMKKNRPLIVACIPTFNEEKTIARVVLQTQRFVDRVVVCDDGSRDLFGKLGSWERIDITEF